MLRREESSILRKMLKFKVDDGKKKVKPKSTWKIKFQEEMRIVNLTEDAPDRTKWWKSVQFIKMTCSILCLPGNALECTMRNHIVILYIFP